GIETHLKKLANSFAPESPGSDFLDWMAPSNVPDLALWALVAFDNQAFKHVTSETRRRALKRVPQDLESCSAIQSEFGRAVLMAHTLVTGALDEIERSDLKEKLRSLNDSEMVRRYRWTTFTALYLSGAPELRDELETLLPEHARAENVAALAHLFLAAGLAGALQGRSSQYLSNAEAIGIRLDQFADGLRLLGEHGTTQQRESVREILRHLSAEGWVTDDNAFRRALARLEDPDSPH